MIEENQDTGQEGHRPFPDPFFAAVMEKLVTSCRERMTPRMRAMCGAPEDASQPDPGSGPECRGCGPNTTRDV